jgi:prevent-host-death family protein
MSKVDQKGAEEARNQLPDLLEAASLGASTIITRRGKAVAALVPVEEFMHRGRQKSAATLRGSGRGLWGRRASDAIARMRDEWER